MATFSNTTSNTVNAFTNSGGTLELAALLTRSTGSSVGALLGMNASIDLTGYSGVSIPADSTLRFSWGIQYFITAGEYEGKWIMGVEPFVGVLPELSSLVPLVNGRINNFYTQFNLGTLEGGARRMAYFEQWPDKMLLPVPAATLFKSPGFLTINPAFDEFAVDNVYGLGTTSAHIKALTQKVTATLDVG